ncbi:VOC family protein [Streptomyces sp. NPDC026672]|uniref:VOC family protein n=1 Tax=unclassified Streptomyces TaxID=2593676 RepID=UPI003406EA21
MTKHSRRLPTRRATLAVAVSAGIAVLIGTASSALADPSSSSDKQEATTTAPPAPSSKTPSIQFAHVAISVKDLAGQERWYRKAFGFNRTVERFELPDPHVQTAVLENGDGLRIELIERSGSARVSSYTDPLDAAREQGYNHWAMNVRNLDRTYAQLIKVGATAVWSPADAVEPGARFAYVKDPEGNLIELIQPPASR